MENAGRVVKLLKNHIYPTYQLYAVMGNEKTDPHDGLRLGALTVMEWLVRRLGDEAPAELVQAPKSADYLSAGDECLISLHISQGFVVDIVSLPGQGSWNLQITEPDLGSDPGDPNQARQAVPGRVIETNVAFRIYGPQLECGFQTVISDPAGTQQAEVYRLAFIRQLINHPSFGLTQVFPLTHDIDRVDTAGQLNRLLSLHRSEDNQLPCVVFTHIHKERSVPELPKEPLAERSLLSSLRTSRLPQAPVTPLQVMEPPYDMARFAKYGVTLCRTFLLSDALLEQFAAQVKLDISPGDIVVLEPKQLNGINRVFPYQQNKTRQEETIERLRSEMYAYSRCKEVSFGHITFLSAARETLLRSTADTIRQAGAVSQEWEQKLILLKSQWDDELRRQEQARQAISNQLERQKQYIARIEQEKEQLREAQALEKQRMEAVLSKRDEDIAYLRRKLSQPKDHTSIAGWAAQVYAGRLTLHPKAVSLLEERSAKNTSSDLICDALDFLATDYWARRYEQISTEEMLSRCSEKYGRPFDVTPVGTTTIEAFPEQYKIKYFAGPSGEPTDSPLDYHLRVGNDAENLLRIYFLHDDDRKLIVVGSLPRHLRTVTIS